MKKKTVIAKSCLVYRYNINKILYIRLIFMKEFTSDSN